MDVPSKHPQSTIYGRTEGSNVCTFTALLTGGTYVANNTILDLPDSGSLPSTWLIVLAQCMVSGNQMYDNVTQHTPRMFCVHDAAQLMKPRMREVSEKYQCDFEAPLPNATLSNFLVTKLENNSALIHIISPRTTVFLKSHKDYIFFDSNTHGDGLPGAVLAKANHNNIDDLLSWVDM